MASRGDITHADGVTIVWTTDTPGVHRIELRGDMDPSAAARTRRLGVMALESARSLTIDLGGVGSFGSIAVEALEHLRDIAGRQDIDFDVVNRSATVDRVLAAAGYQFDSPFSERFRDDSEGRRAAPFISREDFQAIIAQISLRGRDALIVTTKDLEPPGPRILFVNRAFSDLTGYSADEVIGETPRLLQGELTDRATLDRFLEAMADGEAFTGDIVNYRADGTPFLMDWRVIEIGGNGPGADFYASMQSDVTATRRHTRFSTALTYIDSQAASLGASRVDGEDRAKRMLETLLHAEVALMGDGAATGELVRHDGTVVSATTAMRSADVSVGSDLLRRGVVGTIEHDDAHGGSSITMAVPLDPGGEFESGRVVLHGMHRDRLRLADPNLHVHLITHGLCRQL